MPVVLGAAFGASAGVGAPKGDGEGALKDDVELGGGGPLPAIAAHASSSERLNSNEELPSEEPAAEGVAVMSRMDGMLEGLVCGVCVRV